jgi:hypothetical protein
MIHSDLWWIRPLMQGKLFAISPWISKTFKHTSGDNKVDEDQDVVIKDLCLYHLLGVLGTWNESKPHTYCQSDNVCSIEMELLWCRAVLLLQLYVRQRIEQCQMTSKKLEIWKTVFHNLFYALVTQYHRPIKCDNQKIIWL